MKDNILSVIGAGSMGRGIAQVAATNGWKVFLYDNNKKAIQEAQQFIIKITQRLVDKKRLTENERITLLDNIHYTQSLPDIQYSSLVIEAIIENLDIKKQIFQNIEKLVSKSCLIASNTSSLSIASIAASLEIPERCLGIHFFNPAPLMRLVEIIPAVQTSDIYLKKAKGIISSWKKETVIAKDTPGFIVNRVARPFYGESIRIYEEGIANFATIDHSIKTLGKFKMGPFELMDFIGNDINYIVTETVFKSFYYDPRYKPSFTQKRLMEAGYLGRKTGRGYYQYNQENSTQPIEKGSQLHQTIFERILLMLINEAADALFLHIATATDIDRAMKFGVNYPKGLLEWANSKGIQWCVNGMDQLYDYYREDRYRCSPILRKMLDKKITFELNE